MFDLVGLLFVILIVHGIPGGIFGVSVLRKTKLTYIEKILVGFGIYLFIVPTIPFLLYLLLGIKFTYIISVVSVVLGYIVSAIVFFRAYMTSNSEDRDRNSTSINNVLNSIIDDYSDTTRLVSNVLLLIPLFVTLWVRISSYGAVHFELDPYYYIFIGQQIVTMGHNPMSDATAWYPLKVNHRSNPSMAYMDAMWYTLYTQGQYIDTHTFKTYLYATITSVYPGLAAMFAIFFLYLVISVIYTYHGHTW